MCLDAKRQRPLLTICTPSQPLPEEELYAERKILRWETEMTLAHFDREVGAFEENFSGVSHSDSEERSLCLDDSNGSISSSEVQVRHSFY